MSTASEGVAVVANSGVDEETLLPLVVVVTDAKAWHGLEWAAKNSRERSNVIGEMEGVHAWRVLEVETIVIIKW